MLIRGEENGRRIRKARGHAFYGGRISSIGTRGVDRIPHAAYSPLRGGGLSSWVARSR
jgi:hypothetical protein